MEIKLQLKEEDEEKHPASMFGQAVENEIKKENAKIPHAD